MSYQPLQTPVKTHWDERRLGWLALASFEGFGARTLRKLDKLFGQDGQAALGVGLETLEEMGHGAKVTQRFSEYRHETEPTQLAENLDAQGIRFLLSSDPDYPDILRHSSDPPFALFVRGEPVPDRTLISIVGTRDMTPYGRGIAHTFGRELAQTGIGIVSGLALGIDATAHDGALEGDGYTVAVLGTGNDDASIYPKHNLTLAKRILEAGGTIISEFAPGTEAFKHNFPLRNRVIASLSKATVVIEAAEASGSLITAHLALSENRDVFAVPGPINSPQSEGTNRLLAKGAIPCLSTRDILDHLGGQTVSHAERTLSPIELSDAEQKIIKTLSYPRSIDELARALETSVASLSIALTGLELRGAIAHESGKICAKIRAPKASDD